MGRPNETQLIGHVDSGLELSVLVPVASGGLLNVLSILTQRPVQVSSLSVTWRPALLTKMVEMIRPCLHHPGTRLQIHGMVVGRADSISLLMGELQFDVLMRPALLV